ncbi:hypothetical protein OPV22_010640 [Ensete ventricosum]|uniref:Uncharacterized protein n=1 Tax=Ensete ventricosum TaxID=4639 RepID=A0AAV8RIQ1_ENSVE|nr:hypothetical protein OPV22_010640 [Ensete ventricosum]
MAVPFASSEEHGRRVLRLVSRGPRLPGFPPRGGEAHPPPPLQQRRAPPLSVQAVATRSESFLTRQAGRRSEEFRVGNGQTDVSMFPAVHSSRKGTSFNQGETN